jgi:chromosome segregation ATPase
MVNPLRKLFPGTESVPPALAALDALLAEKGALLNRRQDVSNRLVSYRRSIGYRNALLASVEAQRQAIDAALANSEYKREAAPALTTERQALATTERQLADLEDAARRAVSVLPLLEADLAAISMEMDTMPHKVAPLLRAAIRESMDALAPELAQAEAKLREVYRRIFQRATALDMMAETEKTGEYVSSGLYGELRIPKPRTAAFYPAVRWPEEEQRERAEDEKQLRAEAVMLVNDMLASGAA